MNEPRRPIDLEALARPTESHTVPAPRRRWLWVLLPLLLVLGFIFVFLDAARDLFTDTTVVSVIRPRSVTESEAAAGSVIFQTAGWVEPDPYPTSVTALATGIVTRMLVEESDVVKKGDPICELVSDDALLEVESAVAARAEAIAAAAAARVELRNSEASFTAAIHITEARDAARAELSARRADHDQRKALVIEAEAALRVAESELGTQRFLKGQNAVGPWQVELAEARRDEASARVKALQAAADKAKAETEKAAARARAAERDLKLRLNGHLRVETAKVGVQRTDAAVQAADTAVREAKLKLSRMTVTAPADGVVLTRDAQPGSTVGPKAALPVCTLYDPLKLRVRVDVPQSQVAGASLGQRAEISSRVRRGRPYEGRVIRIIDFADLAKVSLEVQVRITDPDGLLKPDMLCNVRAYRNAEDGLPVVAGTVAVRIPSRCLATNDSVWVVDANTGRAAKRRVKTGRRAGDDVVILEGLNLTDKVIDRGAAGLTEGAPIEVEDGR